MKIPGLSPVVLVMSLVIGLALTGLYALLLGLPEDTAALLTILGGSLLAGGLLAWALAAFQRRRAWTGPKRAPNKRPIAVTIIAWAIFILFLVRLYQVFEPLIVQGVFEYGLTDPLFDGMMPTELGIAIFSSTIYALLSISGIVVLISFLRMKRWSWVVLMTWTFISLTITLFDYFYGDPNYIVMASDTIIAFALNQADVQRIFRIKEGSR